MSHVLLYRFACCSQSNQLYDNGLLFSGRPRFDGRLVTRDTLQCLGHLRPGPSGLVAYRDTTYQLYPELRIVTLDVEILGYSFNGCRLDAPQRVSYRGQRYVHADLIAAIRTRRLSQGNAFLNPLAPHTTLNAQAGRATNRRPLPPDYPTLPLIPPVPERGTVATSDGRLYQFVNGNPLEVFA